MFLDVLRLDQHKPMTGPAILLLLALAGADGASKTMVRVELLAPRGEAGLQSQQWARAFDDLGVSVQIRTRQVDDAADVKEIKRGTLRFVTATGVLDTDGSIAFPGGKKFRLSNTQSLKEWLDGLQVYGAAGAPEIGDNWGLTPAGERQLGDALCKPTTRPKTLDALGLAEHVAGESSLPIRFSELAEKHRYDQCLWPKGKLATGTALAAALESVGLGFAPRRLPNGQTELIIDLKDEAAQWPVGWAIPRGTPPSFFAAALFQPTALSQEPTTLPHHLEEVADKTDIPIVTLRGELDAHHPDWMAIPVAPSTRPSPPVMGLTKLVRTSGMSREYRLDDAGNGFVLIRTQDPRRPVADTMKPPAAVRVRLERFRGQF